MSKKSHRGRPSKRSIASRKGWVTRRAEAKRVAAAKRSAAARKGWETRRANALRAKRSAAARKGHETRRRNTRERAKPTGAPQGGEDFDEYEAPPRDTGGYQEGGIYGGYEGQEEPLWMDFEDWDYESFEGLDSEADDDGDTGGESAKA